jgi:hypothetical protein
MRRVLIIAFIALSGILYSQSNNSYELYSLLIKDEFAGESEIIAIKNLTSLFDRLKNSDFNYLKQNFIDLKNETFRSFKKTNHIADTIRNNFIDINKILILDKNEIDEAFKEDFGWNGFYKKYGKTQGILTFSKVGFDKSMNQALFYYGNQSDWLAGAGYYIFCVKDNGIWKIKGKLMIWIS